MSSPLERLRGTGQSVWLDALGRDMLTDGSFAEMVRGLGVSGVTSNPTIFAAALGSGAYDSDVARSDADPLELFYDLALADVRAAADVLRPAWERSGGRDGFASFELDPAIADDAAASVTSAHALLDRIDRPNAMIKVPATDAGIAAARELTAGGRNVNITLLFSVGAYERYANAYIEGLEARLDAGRDISGVASVASFFVSRVDAAVDPLLTSGSPLRGRAAVANARHAYWTFERLFSGPRWLRLACAGALPQRPLWASTGTKDPAYSDVKYLDELVAARTVTTVPEATLRAFADHGDGRPADMADFLDTLSALADAGVDLDAVSDRLLRNGLRRFETDMTSLLERLSDERPVTASTEGRAR